MVMRRSPRFGNLSSPQVRAALFYSKKRRLARLLGGILGPIITATSAPTTQAVTAGQTAADALLSAGSYESSEGTISSVVVSYTINGASQPGATVLAADDVVAVIVTVTDSEGNVQPFGAGSRITTGIPDAFTVGQWTATDARNGVIAVAISALPAAHGATITDVEYRLGGGAWVSGASTSAFNITGLTNGTAYGIELRAVNSVGGGLAGDLKTRKPTLYTMIALSGSPATTANVGTAYSFTPTLAGTETPITFSIASGSLAAWMTLNTSTGAITGTPTVEGTTTGFTIRATDTVPDTADLVFPAITISAVAPAADYTLIPIYGQSLALGENPNGSEIVTLDATKAITGATQASPIVLTVVGHGIASGQTVYVSGVAGMTQINSHSFEVVALTADTLSLYKHDGNVPSTTPENGTAYGAYVSGGTAARSIPSPTHMMFNGGLRPVYDDTEVVNVNSYVAGNTLTSIIPLTERMRFGPNAVNNFGETMAQGMLSGVDRRCISGSVARAAYNISWLQRDTTEGKNHFTNLLLLAQQAKERAVGTFAVGPLIYKQGESDGTINTSKATYKTLSKTLQSDAQRSFRTAVEIPSLVLPMLVDQQGYQQTGQSHPDIAVANAELHREGAGIVCVAPGYWHNFNIAINNVHLTARGYREVGEIWGEAIKTLLAGDTWVPTHINAAPTRSGTTITIPIKINTAPLVSDTTLIAAIANLGFTYSGAAITNAVITDTGTGGIAVVTLTIASAVGGNLGYAYGNGTNQRIGATFGPRGHLRDSTAGTTAFGTPKHRWMLTDQWVIA